jgi:hypothetical protein
MIHDPEVEKWYFLMAKGGWEKFRYLDTIDDYTKIIEEFQKMYEQTPTIQRHTRARIISGLRQSERELARTQAEYDKFKKYNLGRIGNLFHTKDIEAAIEKGRKYNQIHLTKISSIHHLLPDQWVSILAMVVQHLTL